MLLSSVINDKKIFIPRRQIYWENILKLAEFHDIISPIYYGVLGLEKEISESDSEKFYMKYHKELLLGEGYKDAQEVIAWQMEKNKINGVLLTGVETRNLYPKWELGYTPCLEILITKAKMEQIHEIMTGMDYEEEESREFQGRVYCRVPGIRVVFYDKIPVSNKILGKYLAEYCKRYFYAQKNKYLVRPDVGARYLYRIGKLADAYVMGTLKIRNILDYYQCIRHESLLKQIDAVEDVLEKAGLGDFEEQVDILAALWFGQCPKTDTTRAFMLEKYIFSKCMESDMVDTSLVPCEQIGLDFYQRNREEEWGKKRREWIFPSKDYMVYFFPVLKKFPCLIWICWGIRGSRILLKSMIHFIRKKQLIIKNHILQIKTKVTKKISKGRNVDT